MFALVLHLASQLRHDRKAVTALEYGLIAGVLGVIIITAFTGLGNAISTMFTGIETAMGKG